MTLCAERLLDMGGSDGLRGGACSPGDTLRQGNDSCPAAETCKSHICRLFGCKLLRRPRARLAMQGGDLISKAPCVTAVAEN